LVHRRSSSAIPFDTCQQSSFGMPRNQSQGRKEAIICVSFNINCILVLCTSHGKHVPPRSRSMYTNESRNPCQRNRRIPCRAINYHPHYMKHHSTCSIGSSSQGAVSLTKQGARCSEPCEKLASPSSGSKEAFTHASS
jgi:hypothetical protein